MNPRFTPVRNIAVLAASFALAQNEAIAQGEDQAPFAYQHAVIADGVHFDVPVDLKNLNQIVDRARVTCDVRHLDDNGTPHTLGRGEVEIDVPADGVVSGTYRIIVFPFEGESFTAANNYFCFLKLRQTEGGGFGGWQSPHALEAQNSSEDYHTADPGEPYMLSVEGDLPEPAQQ